MVLIGLGSNRGASIAIVLEAMDRLERFAAGTVRRSGLWRTSPVDCPPGAADFINAAAAFEAAPDLKAAQLAFASLSDEAIKYRETRCCNRPVVVYCSMEKKSWMQTDAKVIGNPYVDAKMRTCGEVKAD